MYTLVADGGAYYVDAANARVVFDALKHGDATVTFRTAPSKLPAALVTLAGAEVLALLAHDAFANAGTKTRCEPTPDGVVALTDYLARRGHAAGATP